MVSQTLNHSFFETYKSLFDKNYDACYGIDRSGKIQLFNDASVELSGYSRQEVLGRHYASLMPKDSMDDVRACTEKIGHGQKVSFMTTITNKRGEQIELHLTAIPVIKEGEFLGTVGMARDISRKYMVETLLSGQNEVLELIAKGVPLKEVLDSIAKLFETITKARCMIFLMDQSNSSLHPVSAPSLEEEFSVSMDGVPVCLFLQSCTDLKNENGSISAVDILSCKHWVSYRREALKQDIRSGFSAPFLDQYGNILGVFALFFDIQRKPAASHRIAIEKATYLTSLAVQHYQAEDKLNFLVYHDELTGLPNRRRLAENLDLALKKGREQKDYSFSLLYVDIDRFKQINDSLGTSTGDILLTEVAARLQECASNQSHVYRWGGDDFLLFLDGPEENSGADHMAQRIFSKMDAPFLIKGHEIYISPGIGISRYPEDGSHLDELIRKADTAMFQAKKEGRNHFLFFNPDFDKMTIENLELEIELGKALAKEEFTLQYQPIIDLESNRISAVEALLRWNHPQLGQIPPGRFIPIAEETGMIFPIGEWVLREACGQMKAWRNIGLELPTMSVNISIRQFYQSNLVKLVSEIIKEAEIEPDWLTIEITETMTMDVEAATKILYDLKKLGIKISIDDFGTGYSSFSYLKKFPIDYLKIDKAFIRDIATNKDDEDIASAILLMAKKLRLFVIAEGVETAEQLGILKENECNKAQGFLFSQPVKAEELERLVKREF